MAQETILFAGNGNGESDRIIKKLSLSGYRVSQVESGEEALAICRSEPPGLVLLDADIRDTHAFEVARQLHEAGIPFLYVSNSHTPENINQAAALGAQGYLLKPLDFLHAEPAIRTALERAKEFAELHKSEESLSKALSSSRAISLAVGLTMERYGISADDAFETLRRYSRSSRKKMEAVATALVEYPDEVDLSAHVAAVPVRMLFEMASDPIFVLDMQLNFREVNEAACKHTGYSRSELLRMHPMGFNDEASIRNMPKHAEVLKRDRQATFEAVHIRKDGTRVPVGKCMPELLHMVSRI